MDKAEYCTALPRNKAPFASPLKSSYPSAAPYGYRAGPKDGLGGRNAQPEPGTFAAVWARHYAYSRGASSTHGRTVKLGHMGGC